MELTEGNITNSTLMDTDRFIETESVFIRESIFQSKSKTDYRNKRIYEEDEHAEHFRKRSYISGISN